MNGNDTLGCQKPFLVGPLLRVGNLRNQFVDVLRVTTRPFRDNAHPIDGRDLCRRSDLVETSQYFLVDVVSVGHGLNSVFQPSPSFSKTKARQNQNWAPSKWFLGQTGGKISGWALAEGTKSGKKWPPEEIFP
jgi:hypothetical protein